MAQNSLQAIQQQQLLQQQQAALLAQQQQASMFAQQQQQANVLAQQAIAGQGQPAPGAVQPAAKLEIVPSSTARSFFVKGAYGNDDLKKKLKELGGHHNAHEKGWKFPTRKMAEVCAALDLQPNVDLVDPRKVVVVEFTQQFQWPGDMSILEQKMKEVGLEKRSKGNVYTGDLNKANAFLRVFNVSSGAPNGL
jgi:hypothetical protein